MMKVLSLHHLSITVTDIEKSKHFYGEILGLKEIPRPNFDFTGAWYEIGHQQLHLIVYPESSTFRKRTEIDTKDAHIALRVKDYHQALESLKSNDVPFMENHGTRSGFVQVFCTDPDYNLIELNIEG